VTVRDVLADSVLAALADLEVEPLPTAVALERPARPEHGDWSSNVALTSARAAGRSPRELAVALAERLTADPPPHVAAVEVAGPGFVNFRLRESWLYAALRQIVREGTEDYARHDTGKGERIQIEFVSANPTGPLHVGNGWLCSYGDALGRILDRCGWTVSREYYVNDTGGQIRRLGESLLARRRGEVVPEEGYQGEYVSELARLYDGADDVVAAGRWAAGRILDNIRSTLEGLGIEFDEWFSQASIEESGAVEETIGVLAERGLVYESDGATWLRSTAVGDSRDRVLVKSDGEFTYLAGDLAYHRDKFLVRGYDRVIDIFGADHHGQVASLLAGVQALGVEAGRLEVELGQMVSLADGKMSKRSGNFVSLDSLVSDIGPDATRLRSLMTSIDQATTLDLELIRRQSMENPVYYVQYAYARIASIDRVRRERGIDRHPVDRVDLGLLTHERELAVLRSLTELPDVVLNACRERAPHKVTTWVRQLAGDFHGFYHDCYVMGQGVGDDLTQARLWLVEGARIGLAVGLGLLGVTAPESM
jgi:arginyl-tRNA synthetase